MGNEILSFQIPQGVFKFHQLNKQVMLRIQTCSMHWALEVETQPFLNTTHAASLSKIQEQDQVYNDRRSQNAVAAQEINFDLHGITKPAVDVDVVPSFFIISARRVIVDPHLVREISVKVGVKLRLQNLIQHRQLAFFLRFERIGVVQNFSVAISKNIRREPSIQAQHARFQTGSYDGLHQSLTGFEILAANSRTFFLSQLRQRGDVYGQVRGSVGDRYPLTQGRVGVDHAR